MKPVSVVLSGVFIAFVLSACGASGTTSDHATTSGSTRNTGSNSTTAITPPPATTLVTIPPTPAVAAAPTTVSPTAGAGASNAPCPSLTNVAVTVRPDTTLDNLFQSYGDAGRGTTWTGGDGTESVSLGAGRELWFFSDSYLGAITNGQRLDGGAHVLHNTAIIERKGVLTKTLYKGRKTVPIAFLSPVPQNTAGYAFWPGSMVVNGRTLQVLGVNVRFTGGASTVLGNSLATFALPSLHLLGLQTLPPSPSQTDWSGGILHDGGYTYIYGSSQNNTYSARVVGDDLTAPWSYYDGNGWTADAAAAVPIENIGTTTHFSVSKVGNLYIFIAKSSWMTNEITAAFGCSPVGPFGPSQPIYGTPEGAEYPSGYGVVTYGAFAHPELSTLPNTLVVSYDVGAAGPLSSSITDSSVYRPRFVDVTVSEAQ